jgi:hypothetical protein
VQSYIVRVYRRNPKNMDDVAGIVEKVGTEQKYSFLDLSALQESLEHFIKSDDFEFISYSEAGQIDMYGFD